MAMNLADEIMEQAASELAREIDREVLWGMLVGIGWRRVMINRNYTLEINDWLVNNCKGPYEFHNRDFLFEDEKDATMFILRWVE
jgi:hypothetical protein